MKIVSTIRTEETFCDICISEGVGNRHCYARCACCGKDVCSDHSANLPYIAHLRVCTRCIGPLIKEHIIPNPEKPKELGTNINKEVVQHYLG